MSEKKIGYDDAYSLKTPGDSKKLYKKWAETYDEDFALNSNYLSPFKISSFFNKHSKITDTLPRIIILQDIGFLSIGRNSAEEKISKDIFNSMKQTILDSYKIGNFSSISKKEVSYTGYDVSPQCISFLEDTCADHFQLVDPSKEDYKEIWKI